MCSPYRQTSKRCIFATLCFSFLSFLFLFSFLFLHLCPTLPTPFLFQSKLRIEGHHEEKAPSTVLENSSLSVTSETWDCRLQAWHRPGPSLEGKPDFPRPASWWQGLSTDEPLTKGDEWMQRLETKNGIFPPCLNPGVVFPSCRVALFFRCGERNGLSGSLVSWHLLSQSRDSGLCQNPFPVPSAL